EVVGVGGVGGVVGRVVVVRVVVRVVVLRRRLVVGRLARVEGRRVVVPAARVVRRTRVPAFLAVLLAVRRVDRAALRARERPPAPICLASCSMRCSSLARSLRLAVWLNRVISFWTSVPFFSACLTACWTPLSTCLPKSRTTFW